MVMVKMEMKRRGSGILMALFCLPFLTATSLSHRRNDVSSSHVNQRYRRLQSAEETPAIISLNLPTSLFKNQTSEEAEYYKFHKCFDAGEAYGAAYIITREHLILHKTNYNLTWVNCEMASFIMMNQRGKRHLKNETGTIIQALDVLDYSVIHLSAYERLQRRHKQITMGKNNPKFPATMNVMRNLTASLMNSFKTLIQKHGESIYTPEQKRTLAIMPFLGNSNGAGHSNLENRYEYLRSCFWSLKHYFPNIVVGVSSMIDFTYARNTSGLGFYDVVLLPNLPKGASLPVGTVQAIKERFINGTYDFDYIFFTESDQLLLFRHSDDLYNIFKKHPRYIAIPHRLMPYPDLVVSKLAPKAQVYEDFDWKNRSCCMKRQNCLHRDHWTSVNHPSVAVARIHDILVPLGNTNFLREQYHSCHMHPDFVEVCR